MEESLASLSTLDLPAELGGLSHLAIGDRAPQVSFRRLDSGRKIRDDASARYFDPDTCQVVIDFVPIEGLQDDDPEPASNEDAGNDPASEFDGRTQTDEFVEALKAAEEQRPFVGLKWFRDQYLPASGHSWARDPQVNGALLRRATEQRLVLTSQIPNPNNPLHPVTAIRVNRRHPRLQPALSAHSSEFRPVRIRGGSISDTVLADRR
jgi:hypothetical protein